MRKAFSMITAIFVILMMATVSALILNISSKTVKSTTMQYKQEQAILYAKSYTELAIMYATANDPTSGNCAKDIVGKIGTNAQINAGSGYRVVGRISYIGNGLDASCRQLNVNNLTTPNERQIMIDVYVRYHDESVASAWTGGGTAPWLTYHRRTLQKL